MKKHIPNMLTCCNLLSGAFAVIIAVNGGYSVSLLLILLAAAFDFLDGFAARLLHVSSPIGKELDSLADCISFGLAPAVMLFSFTLPFLGFGALLALIMAAFSALRLAKFNLDDRQTTSFIGLATPANAIFWASLIAAYTEANLPITLGVTIVFIILSFGSCYLLVSEIPFFSLKFHDYKFYNNFERYVFLIADLIILIIALLLAVFSELEALQLFEFALTSIIVLYIISNIAIAIMQKFNETTTNQ